MVGSVRFPSSFALQLTVGDLKGYSVGNVICTRPSISCCSPQAAARETTYVNLEATTLVGRRRGSNEHARLRN